MLYQRSRIGQVPFWPADSILDTPLVVGDWLAIAADAEAKAQAQLNKAPTSAPRGRTR